MGCKSGRDWNSESLVLSSRTVAAFAVGSEIPLTSDNVIIIRTTTASFFKGVYPPYKICGTNNRNTSVSADQFPYLVTVSQAHTF